MHTVKLKIKDDIYNHIMFLLKSLDKKKIEIIEENFIEIEDKNLNKRLKAIEIDTTNFKFDREKANER